jgi:cyanuric acid amidohydrolase
VALKEVDRQTLTDSDVASNFALFSSVASTSAGGEVVAPEVIVFGNSARSASPYRIGHAILRDVIDADGVKASLRNAGLPFDCVPDEAARRLIVHVFAKAEAAPSGAIRGRRHTMLSDADINFQRHARAAIGAVIASVTGDTANFISGATEHQCAPGEAPIAAIVQMD